MSIKNLFAKKDSSKSSAVTSVPTVLIHGRLLDVRGLIWYGRMTEKERQNALTASILFRDGKPYGCYISKDMDACGMGEKIVGLHVDDRDRLVIDTEKFQFTMIGCNLKEMENFYKIEALWRSTFAQDLFGRMAW